MAIAKKYSRAIGLCQNMRKRRPQASTANPKRHPQRLMPIKTVDSTLSDTRTWTMPSHPDLMIIVHQRENQIKSQIMSFRRINTGTQQSKRDYAIFVSGMCWTWDTIRVVIKRVVRGQAVRQLKCRSVATLAVTMTAKKASTAVTHWATYLLIRVRRVIPIVFLTKMKRITVNMMMTMMKRPAEIIAMKEPVRHLLRLHDDFSTDILRIHSTTCELWFAISTCDQHKLAVALHRPNGNFGFSSS